MTTARIPRVGRFRRNLASQILLFQILILAVSLAAGSALAIYATRERIDDEALRRGEGIAQAVAVMPQIVRALETEDRSGTVQRLSETVRKATGVEGVVVADRHGIRYSHPVPERIGTPVSVDPTIPLSGRTELVVTTGSLGRGARARVPIRGADGDVLGFAAVTVLQRSLSKELATTIPVIALYAGIALTIGLAASFLLARVLKRQTFGLELGEIADLLREREATLRGIREGVVAVAPDGRITVVNDEARRLLQLPDVVGRIASDVADGRLGDLLSGRLTGQDLLVGHGERVLVASRMPVRRDGRDLGAVVTLRDRTEIDELARNLASVQGLTEAMRAQAHEFSNRLHTISGLLWLGNDREALDYVTEISDANAELSGRLRERVADPRAAALLLAKSSVAAERGVELRLADDLRLDGTLTDVDAVLTVLGNLIDNAIDAARTADGASWVEVTVTTGGDNSLAIRVVDSGPGIPVEALDKIFEVGFTTKPPSSVGARGVGLALVRRTVARRGGTVCVLPPPDGAGAVFEVALPEAVRPVRDASAEAPER